MDYRQAIRGDRVRRLRKERGMTQGDLAQASAVSQSYLSEIENGRQDSVGTIVILGLANALGTSVEYLIGASEDPAPTEPIADLSEEDWRILRSLSQLSESDRQTVADLIASLVKRRSHH